MDCSLPGSSVHGIYQQKYWSELPFPPPGDMLDPGIEPGSLALQADSLPSEPQGKPTFSHITKSLDIYLNLSLYLTFLVLRMSVVISILSNCLQRLSLLFLRCLGYSKSSATISCHFYDFSWSSS